MTVLQVAAVVSTLLLMTSLPPGTEAGAAHSWRYIFPFYPAELDMLIGHLRTSVKRLEEVLKQCAAMVDGEWEGEVRESGVMHLSASRKDAGDDLDMEKKVETIVELREEIEELEGHIEECRFAFWTGDEAD